jgi:hypothetical protein
MLEIFHARVFIDWQEFDACDLGKVPQVSDSQGITEAGVVYPASVDPGCRGSLQVGARQL